MKKIGLFACDIDGTFYGGYENRKEVLEQFVYYLKQIVEEFKMDELVFSFYTGGSYEESLFYVMDELRPYLEGTKISLGNQYMRTECYSPDKEIISSLERLIKPCEILKQISLLKKDNSVIWLGFADDGLDPESKAWFVDKIEMDGSVIWSGSEDDPLYPGSKAWTGDKNITVEVYIPKSKYVYIDDETDAEIYLSEIQQLLYLLAKRSLKEESSRVNIMELFPSLTEECMKIKSEYQIEQKEDKPKTYSKS